MRSRWPILALLCVLASFLVPGIASAHSAVGAEDRVWAFDLQDGVRVGGSAALTLELHRGCELAEYDFAFGSLLAARGAAKAVDANKLHHIFGRGGHGLDDVVKAAGSREAAYRAIEKAAHDAFNAGKMVAEKAPGVFRGTVNVGGVGVTVRGAVVDGVFRIGSAWRR